MVLGSVANIYTFKTSVSFLLIFSTLCLQIILCIFGRHEWRPYRIYARYAILSKNTERFLNAAHTEIDIRAPGS